MMKKKTSTREKGITLIALIVTIIVLLILAGVTINLAVNNQGIFNKAKTATRAYKNATEEEEASLALLENEIDKYIPKNDDSKVDDVITYTDSSGNTKPLTKDTPAGTKIGTTANISGKDDETGVNLDWYLFDVDETEGKAYLVSTPTYWVPDTDKTRAVNGALVPKLVSSADSNTNALRQAIQKLENGTNSYNQSSVTYTPSDKTWNYFKSVNSQWSAQRGSTAFESLNENEQAACYVADADIFEGIKDQVNKAEGNLKGKIQTLVGGASAEQWCKAYNKQSAAKDHQITCEYRETSVPGYIYKVNDKQSTVSNSDYYTGTNTIFGNDIYGAANNNGNTTNNPFYNNSWWWLASPSSLTSIYVCRVYGIDSSLNYSISYNSSRRFSLFASVSL